MWLIVKDNGKKLQLTWGVGAGLLGIYNIGQKSIAITVAKIRDELNVLTAWGEGDAPDLATRRRVLHALANHGRKLKNDLFEAPGDSLAPAIRARFEKEEKAGDRTMAIQADIEIHIPWGLIFDGPVPPLGQIERDKGPITAFDVALLDSLGFEGPGALSLAELTMFPDGRALEREMREFSGFWALKYKLSTTVTLIEDEQSVTQDRSDVGLLSLLNASVLSDVKAELGDAFYNPFERLLSTKPVGRASTLDECKVLVREGADSPNVIFYLLAHHSNSSIILSEKETISLSDLRDLIKEIEYRGDACQSKCCLGILNGCSTAVGDDDMTLRIGFSSSRSFGSIATEARVPTLIAAQIGQRVLVGLVEQGISLSQILKGIYFNIVFWPFSLLYGCYADPNYRVSTDHL